MTSAALLPLKAALTFASVPWPTSGVTPLWGLTAIPMATSGRSAAASRPSKVARRRMCGRSTRWDALAPGRDKNTGVAAMLRRILRFLTVDCPKTDEFVHVAAAQQLLTRHLLTWSSTSLPPLLPFFRSTCSRDRVNRSGTDCGIRSIGGLYDDTGNSLDLADGQLSVLKPSPFYSATTSPSCFLGAVSHVERVATCTHRDVDFFFWDPQTARLS